MPPPAAITPPPLSGHLSIEQCHTASTGTSNGTISTETDNGTASTVTTNDAPPPNTTSSLKSTARRP